MQRRHVIDMALLQLSERQMLDQHPTQLIDRVPVFHHRLHRLVIYL